MRMLCAAVTATFCLIAAFADDKKPEPNKERIEQLAKLQMRFDEEMADLNKRLARADSDGDRKGIQVEIKEQAIISSQNAIDIAKDDPKDETGFAAALFVIEKAGPYGAGKEMADAVGIIAEHHADNPKVKTVLPFIGKAGPAGRKFLEAAAEKSKDPEVKGVALLFLGVAAAEQIDEGDAKKTEELIATATNFLEKAVAEAPNAKVGTSTVAKEAASQLENIKAIKFLAVGQPAPEIETLGLDGKKVKLSDSKGKVVMLDFWATWCPPCRAMIPHEREMVKNFEKKPFSLVSVSVDAEKETLTEFLEKEPMPWTHWWQEGAKNPSAKKYRIRAFPTIYVIDHKGIIRYKWVGSPGNDTIDKAIGELVKEAEAAKK